jgi:hypothetical protein
VLYLNVLKIDPMLYLPPHLLLTRLDVSSPSQHWLGIRRLLSLFRMLVTLGTARAPCGRVKRLGKLTGGAGVQTPHPSRLSRCPCISKPLEKIMGNDILQAPENLVIAQATNLERPFLIEQAIDRLLPSGTGDILDRLIISNLISGIWPLGGVKNNSSRAFMIFFILFKN